MCLWFITSSRGWWTCYLGCDLRWENTEYLHIPLKTSQMDAQVDRPPLTEVQRRNAVLITQPDEKQLQRSETPGACFEGICQYRWNWPAPRNCAEMYFQQFLIIPLRSDKGVHQSFVHIMKKLVQLICSAHNLKHEGYGITINKKKAKYNKKYP